MGQTTIESAFVERTPQSQKWMERARQVMPAGTTRDTVWHPPYTIVIDRGHGPRVWDLDGNEYIDLFCNGLSLIHGHAFPPITQAIAAVLQRGTCWPVASVEQIELAETLSRRLPAMERLRFTNSGTEAGMLAVKIARAATRRRVILKAWAGYHGSYDDLEVGLYGQGPIEGRVLLGEFGDAESFERILDDRGDEIAAVVLEPMLFTGIVTPPPAGFLNRVQEAARRAGALFVLDDCLMLRLAFGGSAEKYDLVPDLTFLGKFIGGGTPMGVVGGRVEVMSVVDPSAPDHIYHGGSFNGNLVGCVAASACLQAFTQERIDDMDRRAARLRGALEHHAAERELPLTISGEGSCMGMYLTDSMPRPADPLDIRGGTLLSIAAQNHGVYMGPGCEIAMCTTLTDDDLDQAIAGLSAALDDVAAERVGEVTATSMSA